MAVNDFYINVNVVPCELKTPAMTTIYGVHVPAELIHGTRLAKALVHHLGRGTRKRAADRLASARPKKRPASATNRDSRRSVGVATAARFMRDGVTGSA